MYLKTLCLIDFRNFRAERLELHEGVNIFLGENGAGKTNILEAAHLLAAGRSHRALRDQEMVRWGESGFIVRGEVVSRYSCTEIHVAFDLESGKSVRVNGRQCTRTIDALGHVRAVLFSPADLLLVKGTPALRRRFLDQELSQADRNYYAAWRQYFDALLQRNSFLKEASARRQRELLLEVWDEQLLEPGARLAVYRAAALARLGPLAAEAYARIAGEEGPLCIRYQCGFGDWLPDGGLMVARERFASALRERRGDELAKGMTLVGPHRDDFTFLLGGRDARLFGSQGQQRMASLALRLAEVSYLHELGGERPTVLLDDVLSELDERRRQALLQEVAGEQQVLLTCTSWPAEGTGRAPAHLFRVRGGSVWRCGP